MEENYCNDCAEYLVECPHCGEEFCPDCGRTALEILQDERDKQEDVCRQSDFL